MSVLTSKAMNSGALVKVETRESWMERMLGARGARILLAAGGTIAVVLSVPPGLIEQTATSAGLAERLPLLAPPVGLGARLLLGGTAALAVAAAIWTIWGPARPALRPRDEDHDEIEEDDGMKQARKAESSSGWGALIRLVRGGFHDEGEDRDTTLPRRRRDRHPDAPPRPPLFASRDLPPVEEAERLDDHPAAPAAPAPDAPVSFSAAVALARPAPMPPPMPPPRAGSDEIAPPRSPEPLSDLEIARVVANMAPRQVPPVAAAPQPAGEPGAPSGAARSARLLRDIELPLIVDADLTALAARFERGLAKREAIVHAETAQQSLHARMALAQPDPSVRTALRAQRPVELVGARAAAEGGTAPEGKNDRDLADESALRVDEEVEAALNNALATLRRLTEQGRR